MNPEKTDGHYYKKEIIEQALILIAGEELEITKVLLPKRKFPMLIETSNNETMLIAHCYKEDY